MAFNLSIVDSSLQTVTKFAAAGGQYTITITNSNPLASWVNVSPSENDWCKIDSSAATDSSTWVVVVTAKVENTGNNRVFGVYVEAEDASQNFAIEQEAGTAVQPLSGEITETDPDSRDIYAAGETFKVYVKTTNGTDNLSSASVVSGSFCTLTGESHGQTDSHSNTVTIFTFTFAANTTYSTRSATLSFTVSNGVDTYSISYTKTQEAAAPPPPPGTIDFPDIHVAATDTSASVNIILSNVYSSGLAVTKPSWVTSATIDITGSVPVLNLVFPANTAYTANTGNIVVSGTDTSSNSVSCTRTITQDAAEHHEGEISIENKGVSAEDGSFSLEIATRDITATPEVVDIDSDWITSAIISTSGGKFYIDVTYGENTSHDERIAQIGVGVTDIYGNYLEAYFDVIQAGAKVIKDRIYRIDYNAGALNEFQIVKGKYPSDDASDYIINQTLYEGDLGFDTEHPIESVVHFETDDIQKIYWVDGKNVLRFANIAASLDECAAWDNTSFDSNRVSGFGVKVDITKDNSGETRANGVTQYMLTYFNKHGQETGVVWMSDIVYLSPLDHGGAADGTNMNQVYLKITGLDTSFTHFRIYSIFRSSLDGQVQAFLVGEQKTSSDEVLVIDDGAHLEAQDATRLLYLGSKPLKAGTLEHKDNTLFLGDLQSIGRSSYDDLEEVLRANMFDFTGQGTQEFIDGTTWESKCIEFQYSSNGATMFPGVEAIPDIHDVKESGNYAYSNQLKYTSSEILTFKGGEKYRFALKFQMRDGSETDAFWIGDKENTLYPMRDGEDIKRIVALCTLPEAVVTFLRQHEEFVTVRLCIAEAGYADRSVKAQGIVNPTMFNTWERYMGRVYSFPSWISRVRGSSYANSHFDVVERSEKCSGEIQCNWWKDVDGREDDHDAYFQYKNYDSNPSYFKNLPGGAEFDKLLIAFRIRYKKNTNRLIKGIFQELFGILTSDPVALTTGTLLIQEATIKAEFEVTAYIIKAKFITEVTTSIEEDLEEAVFKIFDSDAKKSANNKRSEFESQWTPYGSGSSDSSKKNWYYAYNSGYDAADTDTWKWRAEFTSVKVSGKTLLNHGMARSKVEERMKEKFLSLGLGKFFPHSKNFHEWCHKAIKASNHTYYTNQRVYGDPAFPDGYTEPYDAVNAAKTGLTVPDKERWFKASDYSSIGNMGESGNLDPAYYKKHLMFVDENIVTLDSPELEYGLVQFDEAEYNFRIVGAVKMTSVMSDYTVDATHSSVPGESLDREIFSGSTKGNKNIAGLITWPLWKEYGLRLTKDAQKDEVDDDQRAFSDFEFSEQIVRYWLYMWQHPGSISGYSKKKSEKDEEDEDQSKEVDTSDRYSELKNKTWANLRYGYDTMYLENADAYIYDTDIESIRTPLEYNTNTLRLTVGGEMKDYASNVQLNLLPPGDLKYPLCYSDARPGDINEIPESDGAFLYSSAPVLLEYATRNHAVISFKTWRNVEEGGRFFYKQRILPYFLDYEKISFAGLQGTDEYTDDLGNTSEVPVTGALIPWEHVASGNNYIRIQRNGGDIANPIYEGWGTMYSDAGFTVQYKASGSGDQFDRYVTILQSYRDAFPDGEVYVAVDLGNSNSSGQLTSGARLIVLIDDIAISKNEDTGVWTITMRDPHNIGSAVIDTGHDDDVSVNIYGAMYDSYNGITFNYEGSGSLDVGTSVITMNAYPYRDYEVIQNQIDQSGRFNKFNSGEKIENGDQYMLIGEIYETYADAAHDTRYGGIKLSNVKNNRFINAGPSYEINKDGNIMYLFANEGDTYFQRWDSLRVKPYSDDAINRIIDITSVMVETHINLDGRTDLQRGINELASIDITKFGQINRVYSQPDNFVVRRDLDEDFNTDSYRSSITWTLPKADMAAVDEWTHVTLANTLKLDGDKGPCNSLKRFQNRLLAFQDRGISEIYFNAMTQIGTQEGVPIEIANSGKVTGKGYFTNKFGCTNKWSIAEGKAGLYFIDNINKAFCSVTVGQRGQLGAADISTGKGFKVWFKNMNNLSPWKPEGWNNFISFFDRMHNDIYLVKGDSVNAYEAPCLVFNETLGEFTSFFDYGSVPMIANVDDRLVSLKNKKLWLQNEGLYCNFFGTQYPFWMQYRVTPDPYGDKIWTNLEYRADFYRTLDDTGKMVDPATDEDYFSDDSNIYQPNETFSFMRFWNEYQTTEDDESKFTYAPDKKFRIWRYQIPRAKQDDTYNKYGLDRIRNPWMNILLKKKYTSASDVTNQDLMQMHDMTVIYFE